MSTWVGVSREWELYFPFYFTDIFVVILMGNEKFPGENEFDEFLQKHGGYVNAATDPEEVSKFIH